MPTIKSSNTSTKDNSVSKGVLYLIGVAAFVLLWLIGYGADLLIYRSLSPLPLILPLVTSIPIAMLFNRVSRVYPGAASIFGYVATSMLALALAIIALLTFSSSNSPLAIGTAAAILGLIYPTVAVGFCRAIEVFMEKLGLFDNAISTLDHYDTIKERERSEKVQHEEEVVHDKEEADAVVAEVVAEAVAVAVAEAAPVVVEPTVVVVLKDEPEVPASPFALSDESKEPAVLDYSKAVKTIKTKKSGVEIIELDFDELGRVGASKVQVIVDSQHENEVAVSAESTSDEELEEVLVAEESPAEAPVVVKKATPRKKSATRRRTTPSKSPTAEVDETIES